MKRTAVFFGGTSVEHDVSVITGVMTVNTLDKTRYEGVPIYIDFDGKWYIGKDLKDIENFKNLSVKKLERVTIFSGDNVLYKIKGNKHKPLFPIFAAINCLHGERGEDGSLAGLLKMSKIPLASPPALASSVTMDKAFTKIAMAGIGVKTLPYVKTQGVTDYEKVKKLGYPLIVKPTTLGSSIGIKKANSPEELPYAISFAQRYSESAIIEPLLTGFTEINCAAYRNSKGEIIVSECERPIGQDEVLTFNDKYAGGSREFPANIDKKISDKIKKTTKRVYEKLNFSGIVRIDYFVYNGEVFVNEINSVPGSLAYYLFSDTLKGFSEILNDILTAAERNFVKENGVKTRYDSSLLNLTGIKSAKRL